MTVLVRIPATRPPDTASHVHEPNGVGGSDSRATRFAEVGDPDDETPDLEAVVRRIRGAKRIVVVCGAGVSTAADIPDFRSAHGLFAGSKGRSVKDLFHVKSLTSAALLPDHHALLSHLSRVCDEAEPTDFHALLKTLDDDGRLLRCYTQNIDGLEERAGLRTGIPTPPPKRRKSRATGAVVTARATREGTSATATEPGADTRDGTATPAEIPPTSESQAEASSQPLERSSSLLQPPSQPPSAAASPTASGATTPNATDDESYPPAPRCIPLHGLLSTLHCTLCSTRVPLSAHLPLPGEPIACPECDEASMIRSALSERARKVGTLRASVVLYGEDHPEGELIGSVMERDLRGTGRRGEREGRADLLIVAGTSLSIPGVKRMVKEMAKSLAARTAGSVREGREPPIRTLFVNSEPPAKAGEWDGVFDVWCQGDVQHLAALVGNDEFAKPLPKVVKPARTPKKKTDKEGGLPTPSTGTPKRKRTKMADEETTPTKRRGKIMPLTPAPTPPRKRTSSDLPSPSPQPAYSPTPMATEDNTPEPSQKVRAGKNNIPMSTKAAPSASATFSMTPTKVAPRQVSLDEFVTPPKPKRSKLDEMISTPPKRPQLAPEFMKHPGADSPSKLKRAETKEPPCKSKPTTKRPRASSSHLLPPPPPHCALPPPRWADRYSHPPSTFMKEEPEEYAGRKYANTYPPTIFQGRERVARYSPPPPPELDNLRGLNVHGHSVRLIE